MGDEIDWAQTARYLAGECPVAERTRFEAWMSADPARAALVDSLRPYMAKHSAEGAPIDTEFAWRRLEARTHEPVLRSLPSRRNSSRVPILPIRWSVAAATLFIAAAIVTWVIAYAPHPAGSVRQWATANGERRTVTLLGGTRVVLAPATTITVATTAGAVRSLRLTGEAYFTVAHDSRRPFAVFTSGAVVRDIGTRFSVRALPRSTRTDVVVAEGAVEIRSTVPGSDTAALVVRGGESASSDNGRLSVARPADVQQSLAWLQGELVFVDAPLAQVGSELERWYGTPVRVEGDDVRSRTLTVTFAGESLNQALDVIARTLGVRYSREPHTGAVLIRAR